MKKEIKEYFVCEKCYKSFASPETAITHEKQHGTPQSIVPPRPAQYNSYKKYPYEIDIKMDDGNTVSYGIYVNEDDEGNDPDIEVAVDPEEPEE